MCRVSDFRTTLLFKVIVVDSLMSDGTFIRKILRVPASSCREKGIGSASSSMVKVLFTAWTESFEFRVSRASSKEKRVSGKLMVTTCDDPVRRWEGYSICHQLI